MGYFSNGTMGDMYQAQWCRRCVHWKDDPDEPNQCPVMGIHMLHNYTQAMNDEADDPIHAILNTFIPQLDEPPWNEECKMFVERP